MACRIVAWLFVGLYVIALAVLGAGTWGWFGAEPDPLSGVFLIPLGLPWNRLLGFLPEGTFLMVGVLAPAINLAIIVIVCAFLRRRPARV